MSPDSELVQELKSADLLYITDSTAGITRQRQGNTFLYRNTDGSVISSDIVLTRIRDLVIPPAWENVWISPSPNGYLQATGIDEKGRKQYIYHTEWVKRTQENKFNKLLSFAEILPKIREKIYRDMQEDSLDKDKIIATVIWLLEHTLIRIGNEEYAKENDSFGLTTLRSRHVKVKGKTVVFEFRGKSGVEHTVSITHPKIAKIIKECIELPGYEIFQYIDDNNQKHTIDSASVNDYLKEVTKEDTTAKEFRTWGGSVLSAETLFSLGPAIVEKDKKKNVTKAVKKVSQYLRNTTTVCKQYYIHPIILSTYENGTLIPHFDNIFQTFDRSKSKLTRGEFATLTLLQKYS